MKVMINETWVQTCCLNNTTDEHSAEFVKTLGTGNGLVACSGR